MVGLSCILKNPWTSPSELSESHGYRWSSFRLENSISLHLVTFITATWLPCDIVGAIWSQGWCIFLLNEELKEPQNPQNHRVADDSWVKDNSPSRDKRDEDEQKAAMSLSKDPRWYIGGFSCWNSTQRRTLKLTNTPAKFNIAPEKLPSQKVSFLSHHFSRELFSFGGVLVERNSPQLKIYWDACQDVDNSGTCLEAGNFQREFCRICSPCFLAYAPTCVRLWMYVAQKNTMILDRWI